MLESNYVMSKIYLFSFSIKSHKQTKLFQFVEAKFPFHDFLMIKITKYHIFPKSATNIFYQTSIPDMHPHIFQNPSHKLAASCTLRFQESPTAWRHDWNSAVQDWAGYWLKCMLTVRNLQLNSKCMCLQSEKKGKMHEVSTYEHK